MISLSELVEVLDVTVTQPYWAALVARENATSNLRHVLTTLDLSGYKAAAAYSIAYVEGRNIAGTSSVLFYRIDLTVSE